MNTMHEYYAIILIMSNIVLIVVNALFTMLIE